MRVENGPAIAGNLAYLNNHGHFDPIATIKAMSLLHRTGADVVIAHCSRSIALMKRAALGRVPVVCVMHSLNPKRCVEADAFINITRCIEERLKAEGAEGKPHFLVPNMLPDSQEGLPPERPYQQPVHLGAIGRFVQYKGFDLFLAALGLLKDKGVPFTATLAGDGAERELLENQVKQLGLRDRISMPGWLPNSATLFERIDILCVPSRHEPFGLIILEAFNYGIPLVVTSAEGPSEICRDGEEALVCPVDDPKALAVAMERLIADSAQASHLRRQGFQTLKQRYVPEVVGERLELALETVVANQPQRPGM
jgi:glycosyltransferase involved in cell wall biosynthesis